MIESREDVFVPDFLRYRRLGRHAVLVSKRIFKRRLQQPPANMVKTMEEDTEKPCLAIRAGLETVEGLQRFQIDVLHKVLRLCRVMNQEFRGPVEGREMRHGGGFKVLTAQFVGSLVVCTSTFVAAMVMFKVLDAIRILRLSKEGELLGMDLDQHGISAYPEYVISALTAPHGMGRETVGSGNVPTASENGESETAELVGAR